MAAHSRYSVNGDEDAVLPNKQEITDPITLSDTEGILLNDSYAYFFDLLDQKRITITLPLLFEIHTYFLGTLYTWAGKLRTVDISKNDMMFAASAYLDQSLKDFEKIFEANMLLEKDTKTAVAQKIALVHCELNAIHPFREGNGRTIRLFLDLMVGSIGYQPIDWRVATLKEYLDACIKGMEQNYKPMQKIVLKGLQK